MYTATFTLIYIIAQLPFLIFNTINYVVAK